MIWKIYGHPGGSTTSSARSRRAAYSAVNHGENRDEENLILHRGKNHFIILNAYPYNNGHMMVVPFKHTSTLAGWTDDERREMMELADLAVELLRRTMRPDGFNLGINMGIVGGAGIAEPHSHAYRPTLEWRHQLHARLI